jgi:hypothetical protein
LLVVGVVALAGTVFLHAEESASRLSAAALREIAQLEDEIDRIEAQALERLAAAWQSSAEYRRSSIAAAGLSSQLEELRREEGGKL